MKPLIIAPLLILESKRAAGFVPSRIRKNEYSSTKLAETPNRWEFNPYKAGKLFRDFIEEKTKQREDKRVYYLDERFTDFDGGAPLYASELLPSEPDDEDLMPEVLVVGATGQLGRIVVRKLILEGYRVRVLVRDLYSSTLNLLGTKVIYCKGDLLSYDSLELAVTDVDKIIYCATNLDEATTEDNTDLLPYNNTKKNLDANGLSNLVQSFLNTRVADYGTSQSAKRKLFKFGRDFDLFNIEEDYSSVTGGEDSFYSKLDGSIEYSEELEDDFVDNYDDYSYPDKSVYSKVTNNLASNWVLNNRDKAVFYGRIPSIDQQYSATIISNKLQSKEEDYLNFKRAGFSGLILRVIGDGKTYEAIIRTSKGEEYACPFTTATKIPNNSTLAAASGATSGIPKFITVRLPFRNFQKAASTSTNENKFDGSNVQYFGIRFRSGLNELPKLPQSNKFYLSLAYVKLYRRPMIAGPEIIYLSDAAIPSNVTPDMVRHDVQQIVSIPREIKTSPNEGYEIFNERRTKLSTRKSIERGRRLGTTETYFKYMGEQLIKNSGLNFAILRVAGYNNAPGSDGASMIELAQDGYDGSQEEGDDDKLQLVSRADVAEVCVRSLSSQNACNVFCYVRNRVRRKRNKSIVPGNNSLDYKIAQLKQDL